MVERFGSRSRGSKMAVDGEISYSAGENMCVARSGYGEEWRFDVSEMMARRINGNGNDPFGFPLVRSR